MTFIFVGFAIEAKERSNITSAVWLPFIWMIISASRSVGQWLNILGFEYGRSHSYYEASLEGSIVDQVVLSAVLVWAVMIIYKRRESVIGLLKNNKALLAFTIYLGITVLWAEVPEASFRKWIRLTGNFIMAAVLITEPQPFESIKSLFRRTAYLLIPLSVIFIKYFPHVGILYSQLGSVIWVGAALMKNGLGHLSFMFSFYFLWNMISTWEGKGATKYSSVFDLIVLMMSLWLLKGTSSAASLGSFVFGMTILIASRVPFIQKSFVKIDVLVILTVFLLLVLESSFGIIEYIVISLGRNMTFTDRVPLWTALVDIGLRNPLWGYGYGGFWTEKRIGELEFTQGHSGYLEIFVEGGLVAVILFGILLIAVFRNIHKGVPIDYNYAVFRLSLLSMILLASVTESCIARERDLATFVFYIIALYNVSPRTNVCTLA